MNVTSTLPAPEEHWRPRSSRRTDASNFLELVESLFVESRAWKAHTEIPEWNGKGRPRQYPAVFALYYNAMIHILGTSAAVDGLLDTPMVWRIIRRLWHNHVAPKIAAESGDDPIELFELPYREWHYKYIRETYLTDPNISARIAERQTEDAVDAAVEAGGFDPTKDSWTQPVISNIIVGDATNLKPIARKGTSHADPDADWYKHGGGNREDDDHPDKQKDKNNRKKQPDGKDKEDDSTWHYGVEHYAMSVYIPGLGGNILLATAPVKKGQEMTVAIDCLARVVHEIEMRTGNPPRGYLHDKAARGIHINDIQALLGIIAASKKSKGTPASTNQPSVPHDEWDGYDIRFEGGRPVAYELDVNGNLIKAKEQPKRVQVKRRWSPREQKWRFTVGYEFLGTTHWLRTWNKDNDHYSRAENLRALDEHTLNTTGIGGHRSTAENINSQLKYKLPHGRAHSKGAARQQIDNIGFGYLRAAEARWRLHNLNGTPPTQTA